MSLVRYDPQALENAAPMHALGYYNTPLDVALGAHQWFAEASELRFPPGFFPTRIGTPLGNGQDFVLTRVDADRTHYYGQIFGCIRLTVWND